MGQAFEDGIVDAYSADVAENAVLTSSVSAFRIEGKVATRAFYPQQHDVGENRRTVADRGSARLAHAMMHRVLGLQGAAVRMLRISQGCHHQLRSETEPRRARASGGVGPRL
jgi:hypothetical protein